MNTDSITDNTTTVTVYTPNLAPFCKAIEDVLKGSDYWVMHVQLFLLASILISIAVLIHQYGKHRIAIHGNLRLLFVNILVLYFMHALAWFVYFLRYRILLFGYSDACELLSPVWMTPVFMGPYQVYSIAYPSFHFAITLERIRATFMAHKYEHMGQRMVVAMSCIIWIGSLAYLAYVICSALADPDISGHPQGVIYLTSKYNATPIFWAMILTMALVFATAICDWRIYALNKRIRAARSNSTGYNLSRNYQINENALAMRLIFPLDLSYALLYPVYNAAILVIRAYKPMLSTADFVSYYHIANTLLFLHSLLTIVVYIRFVKFVSESRRRATDDGAKPPVEQARLYFKQLEAQWG